MVTLSEGTLGHFELQTICACYANTNKNHKINMRLFFCNCIKHTLTVLALSTY